jgi:uncharacterized membrane protein YgaE (UPF0421/DUF939 family)
MFESRLQTAQVILWLSVIFCIIAILTLIWAPVVIGIFFLVMSHAAAACGCYLYADVKGYPGLVGIPVGVAFGCVGWIAMIVLPDQTEESAIAEEKRLARRGLRPTRRKDPGYEVLDDDD